MGTTVFVFCFFFVCYEWNKTQIAFWFFPSGCLLCDISSTKSPETYITITFDFNNGNFSSSVEESGIEIFCFFKYKDEHLFFLFNFYFRVTCNWLILLKCGYTNRISRKNGIGDKRGFSKLKELDPLALTSNKKNSQKNNNKQTKWNGRGKLQS